MVQRHTVVSTGPSGCFCWEETHSAIYATTCIRSFVFISLTRHIDWLMGKELRDSTEWRALFSYSTIIFTHQTAIFATVNGWGLVITTGFPLFTIQSLANNCYDLVIYNVRYVSANINNLFTDVSIIYSQRCSLKWSWQRFNYFADLKIISVKNIKCPIYSSKPTL